MMLRNLKGSRWVKGLLAAALYAAGWGVIWALSAPGGASGSDSSAALLLESSCVRCHGPGKAESGLDLSTREGALRGGRQGPALVPDAPELSLMYQMIESGEMPEDRSLPEAARSALLAWLREGALWPDRPLIGRPAPPQDDDHLSPRASQPIELVAVHSKVDFEREVFPILQANCLKCHGPETQRSQLRLDNREIVFRGGRSGLILNPGSAEKSPLFQRIMGWGEEAQMPPKGRVLSGTEAGLIKAWIDQGADWPEHVGVQDGLSTHWAFERSARPSIPGSDPDLNPIDAFLARSRSRLGVSAVDEADRRTLIRRAYFDLIGLPPAPEDVDAFVHDARPGAWEELIDWLLHSPRYGERWARHWLDVARFGESEAYEFDRLQPWAFQYRDFVIRAFNDNLPFDQFLKWQLAGDEQAPLNELALAATGFGAVGPNQTNNPTEMEKYDALDDILGASTQAFLGLTVACARCHNHKYDPILQKDYYRMLAFFQPSRRVNHNLTRLSQPSVVERTEALRRQIDSWVEPKRRDVIRTRLQARGLSPQEQESLLDYLKDPGRTELSSEVLGLIIELDLKNLGSLDADIRKSLGTDELEQWEQWQAELKQLVEHTEFAFGLRDAGATVPVTHLLGGGSPENKQEEVQPGFLPILTREDADPERWLRRQPSSRRGTTYLRSALAEWMIDAEAGAGLLAARVMVNRIWQHLMNEPLVEDPNNFGMAGLPPAHPELLDWLAHEFIAGGWDIKRMQRLILTSRSYRLSSRFDPEAARLDAENRTYWRRVPKRLEAELIRDSILWVSGNLNLQMYGPGVKPRIHPDALATATNPRVADWPADIVDGPETWRRSIYILSRRSVVYPFLETFDGPNSMISQGRRQSTTLPTQSLYLLNSETVREQSRFFAARVKQIAGEGRTRQIEEAYRLALGRRPNQRELALAEGFLLAQSRAYGEAGGGPPGEDAGFRAMTDLCQAIFNLEEFVYIE